MNYSDDDQSKTSRQGTRAGHPSMPDSNDAVSDLVLLERFIEQNDHAAMTMIIARHGPLVMGVCRRYLTNEHDASDAFQATFLVLLKKAKSLRRLNSLAAWLYGVAHRVAKKSRSQSTLRRQREASELAMTREVTSLEQLDAETINLIHVELARLPEKYQLPLILCYLEGLDRESVAQQLGWTIGSLKGRLERGRDMLLAYLKRRGIVVPVALLSAAITRNALAEVPVTLASTTMSSLVLVATGQSLISATGSVQTASLAQGVLKTMLFTNLKISSVLVVSGLLAASGTAVALRHAIAENGKAIQLQKQQPVQQNQKVELALADEKKEDADEERRLKLRREDMNNFKTLGLAMHNYAAARGTFPAAAHYGQGDKPLLSWRVMILPYLDQEALFKQFKLDEPWDSDHNKKLLSKMPSVYRAPTQTNPAEETTFYQVFAGKGTPFDGKKGMSIKAFKDGLASTILISEGGKSVPWTKPADLDFDADKPLPKLGGVFQDGYCNCLGDGSARFIPRDISDAVLRPWITPAAGDVATPF